MLPVDQSAFFDFCAGNLHQIVAGARVTAVKVTPKLSVARVEVAKVAQLIGLSCKCGTNYTLCCGLARVRVESDKIVPKTVNIARGIYSPPTKKNAVLPVD